MGSLRDFSGSPVIKTSSNTGSTDSITDQGAKIPHALQPEKKKRKENRSNIVTNYIKAFLKMVHILKRNAGMLNLTKFLSPM